VRFISRDDITRSSYGWGGHIIVFDLNQKSNSVNRNIVGSLNFNNVGLIRFGKINSNHDALAFLYKSSTVQPLSSVINCAFINSYSAALTVSGTSNSMYINNNVVFGGIGGGIMIESSCTNFTVSNNLVVRNTQLPSILKSLYPWNRPVASFTLFSSYGKVFNNVAAGSVDTGYAVGQAIFASNTDSNIGACSNTYGSEYTVPVYLLLQNRIFFNNEAVGCKIGLTLVTVSKTESQPDDCAVISGLKSWRNGKKLFKKKYFLHR
jgi:hypothetical protein